MPGKLPFIFLGLIVFVSAPIWAVEYFVNQDGPARVYSAHVANELLRGNETYAAIYQLNPVPVPNSTGHWLLMLFLLLFDKFVATKAMVTLTFAILVAAIVWLRRSTQGDGLLFALLFGAAISFNWLWLQGFYNFILGLGGFAFVLGLHARWSGAMNPLRALALGSALVLVYFSHLLCFAAAVGSLVVLAATGKKATRYREMAFAAFAILPSAALCLAYASLSGGVGGFSPEWERLADPFSLNDWLSQVRTADPFLIISRRFAPFVEEPSSLFLAFAPAVWIVIAVGILAVVRLRSGGDIREFTRSRRFGYLVLLVIFLIGTVVSPDTLGDSQGSIIRPRMVLFAAIAAVPLLPVDVGSRATTIASCCLAAVIIFQAASLWDYSLRTDAEITGIVAIGKQLSDSDKIVGVASVRPNGRYAAEPTVHAADLMGVERNIVVWNSFEFGYKLFPVITRDESDRQFIAELTKASAVVQGSADEVKRIESLMMLLDQESRRISAVIVLQDDGTIEKAISPWYQTDESGPIGAAKVFRRRSIQ